VETKIKVANFGSRGGLTKVKNWPLKVESLRRWRGLISKKGHPNGFVNWTPKKDAQLK